MLMRERRLYTVPWIYSPFHEAQLPHECRQFTILLDDKRAMDQLCTYVGIDQNAATQISEWLELGPQGLGVQNVMEVSKFGVGFRPMNNVVLVLRVAAKKTDFCLE